MSVGSRWPQSTALCAEIGRGSGWLAMILALVLAAPWALSAALWSPRTSALFIATLITMTAYRGPTMIYTNGVSNLQPGRQLHPEGGWKGRRRSDSGHPLIPCFCSLFPVEYTTSTQDLRHRKQLETPVGWVNIDRTKIIAYAISGTSGGIIRLISALQTGSAQPTLGNGYELIAIAAVALGGTRLSGGRGKIYGTLIEY